MISLFWNIVTLILLTTIMASSLKAASSTSSSALSTVKRICVVTGANKGIGYEIAKKLGDRSSNNKIHVVLGCRSEALGLKAERELQEHGCDVSYMPLDITSTSSCSSFVELYKQKYGNKCDILINNAAIAFKNRDPTPFSQQAKPTLDINYFGTLDFTMKMLPLLKESASASVSAAGEEGEGEGEKTNKPRIINVASMAGHLKILRSNVLLQQFTSPSLTISQLSDLANQFVHDVEEGGGSHEKKGWPNSCYSVSKLCVVAMTKILARELQPEIAVNCCCPGWCSTDMSSYSGPRSAAKGAEVAVYLATEADSSVTGHFFADNAPIEW